MILYIINRHENSKGVQIKRNMPWSIKSRDKPSVERENSRSQKRRDESQTHVARTMTFQTLDFKSIFFISLH